MAKRPRVMISVAKVGSSDPRYPKARRAMLERKHAKFLESHDTTINVEVTEETRIIDSLERTRIQCTLKLRARVFGEWKSFPNTQEMIDQLDAAGILWETR